jgi:two-component system OmpR family sensor kinase
MNALIERLRQTLAQQQKFLSEAAHELRTPITAIRLQIDNLAEDTETLTVRTDLDDLRQGSRRASTLVDQLLRMARYDAKAEPVHREIVDLAEIALMAVADHVPLAESRVIDLGVLSSQRTLIEGDERDLRVLIGNLIDNAIKYTPSGGTVDVEVSVRNGHSLVIVQDTGPGIDPALLPRISDRFFRAAPATVEGSGLGLAICQAIADRHGLTLSYINRRDRDGLMVTVTARTHKRPEPTPQGH